MKIPPEYNEFLKPDCDRKNFIQNWLLNYGIKSSVLVIDGKNHIYVDFGINGYDSRYRIKNLVAHYDRVFGVAGANDNSSGVFALLNAAKKLSEMNCIHNTRIFFTDGEEEGRKGVVSQGAYSLGKKLIELNPDEGDFYVFDCVGRGKIPVICELELPPNIDKNFSRKYLNLVNQTKNLISKYSTYNNLVLPASYSDNAGLVVNGIPAVAITMLPEDELLTYMNNLRKVPGLKELVMHRKLEDIPLKTTPEYVLRESVPLTWRYIHTEFDKITTLTPISFDIITRLIDDIIKHNYLKYVI